MKFEHYLQEQTLNEMPALISNKGGESAEDYWNPTHIKEEDEEFKSMKPFDTQDIHDDYVCYVYKKGEVFDFAVRDAEDELVLVAQMKNDKKYSLKGSHISFVKKEPSIDSSLVEEFYDMVLDWYAYTNVLMTDVAQTYGGKSIWKRFMKNNSGTATIGVFDISKNEVVETLGENDDFDHWYKETSKYAYGSKRSGHYIYYIKL